MGLLEDILSRSVAGAVQHLFSANVDPSSVIFQRTNPQFEGDITLVVFPYIKVSKKSPEQTATLIGEFLKEHQPEVEAFNVVKGFLNVVVKQDFWLKVLDEVCANKAYGLKKKADNSPFVMVEYSSPNTNKPLHLGHVRNNLLGYSVSRILEADGNRVMKVNLVNDRGIHICKSMLAWQKFGNGETPASSGMKGDHLVGKYYVEFDRHFKAEIESLKSNGMSEEDAQNQAPLMREAKEMLRKWEAGDKEVIDLWKKMNGWVYEGFAESYKKLGVDFDKIYYESDTYKLGKEIIDQGLKKNVLQKEGNAVFIDNTPEGLDKKYLLRSDGTSVYMTQDLGTALERHREFPFDKHIYVVGNEQDYHFKVLKLTLKKLGYGWADGLYHLSYGMVELPEGKMKSREGTVVDADDLIAAMENDAKQLAEEKGLIEGMDDAEKKRLYHLVGMSALKYFILKVDPKKKMLFNPKESIDLTGNTGPFIQYTYARIRSLWRKSGLDKIPAFSISSAIHPKEKELIRHIYLFPAAISESAKDLNPSLVAHYAYELARTFNQFYDACPVLKEEDETFRNFRLALSAAVADTIKSALALLGIDVPERM